MKSFYNDDNKLVLKVNDNLSLTLTDDVYFEYLSHINGFQNLAPNNYVCCRAKGSDKKTYYCFYYVDDSIINEPTLFEDINYDKPSCIENEDGRTIYYERNDGYWERNEYNADGKLTYWENSFGEWGKQKYDKHGNWEKFKYDKNGGLIFQENSDGSKREYNEHGRLTFFENCDGYWEMYEYDENDNNTYLENCDGKWEKSKYNEDGRLTFFENSEGYREKREYDENGNNTYRENSNGNWEKREYDENGNQTYMENSEGYWEKNEYNENGKTYSENSCGIKFGTPARELEKTQVYLLETDVSNEVVLRQSDDAIVFDSAPNGMFNNTVDLYQSDKDGLTDINSIKTALAEYIGNGSDMNSFGEIVNNSLNISTSQTTVMSWEEVNRLVNENNDFKLTFVTEYEDMSHNNDARGNQAKQSMKDKLAVAQTKAAEKNQKREQQEKDKNAPQR